MVTRRRMLLVIAILLTCISVWQILKVSEPTYSYIITHSSRQYEYPNQELPVDDYQQLINLNNFNFNILNKLCTSSSGPLLLVLVHSAALNFERRKAVRETWGGNRKGMKLLFMLGQVNFSIQLELERENEIFHDFVQGNFMDAYENVTYKHVMAFKYAIYHCPQAKYILKTDDDVFVNMPLMMKFLTHFLSPHGTENLLLCNVLNDVRIQRYKSKWKVGFNEYPGRFFPPFCPGWALLYSQNVLFVLYKAVQSAPYFWIDDVHITGTLAKNLKLKHTNAKEYILGYLDQNQVINRTLLTYKAFLYAPADVSPATIRIFWDYVQKYLSVIEETFMVVKKDTVK